ncbi:hypothetical protein F4861DRAFT_495488 [Xylaria intraflava]|nr:hypothetical protein F4861DRAFT_495488 [Xylaria intraflava]
MNTFTIAFFMSLVAADPEIYRSGFIAGSSFPSGLDAYSKGIFTNAQQHPNATRGVTFEPFGSEGNTPNLKLGNIEWTWRINVSDFAAPNAIPDPTLGTYPTVDPHIVTTSYDFTWSGPKNWSTELQGLEDRFCLAVVDFTDLPVNVTNGFTESDTNSTSCVPALGQDCVNAILSASQSKQPFAGPSCNIDLNWSEFPECQNTLGYADKVTKFSLSSFMPGFSEEIGKNITTDFINGRGWYGYVSPPQNGSGSSAYYTALNRLHIAAINPLLSAGVGLTQGPELLCMRVNATALPTGDTNGDGVTLTSEAVLEPPTSAGYSVHRNLDWTSVSMWLVSLMFAVAVNVYSL